MSELTLVVGSKNFSSWSLRPYLALAHTGQPFREVLVPLDTPETAALIAMHSPSGRVPVLKHGDTVVWDSLSICEYLAESFPAAKLWPEASPVRAMARSVTTEMHSGFQALRTHLPMDLTARKTVPGLDAPGVHADIARIQALLSGCRERHGKAGPFLFGDFSIADAFYAPVITRFVTYGVPFRPELTTWRDAVLGLPAMIKWSEAAQGEPQLARYR
ncbi:glutathione S-transferase family protein [Corallococcus sp. bb12-1]|uniref:glutathione S-transferase family protein n=1 Tax=Corallococcus sp. bb12-1 TaxID=2996784 RepID=UPI00227000D6|nr:glutathione S-transferase family protein [Corallococcus sp. bb12-1]MCY1044620.1 glutathione S-transferase family protein [Corallococcus sp. bb12-1]